jgi:hypothetical protein
VSDFLIAAAIVTPSVLLGLWLLMRAAGRSAAVEARKLAAGRACPRCGLPSLEWRGVEWAEDILYDDREESVHGYTFQCRSCGGGFQFTAAGDLHSGLAAGPSPTVPPAQS